MKDDDDDDKKVAADWDPLLLDGEAGLEAIFPGASAPVPAGQAQSNRDPEAGTAEQVSSLPCSTLPPELLRILDELGIYYLPSGQAHYQKNAREEYHRVPISSIARKAKMLGHGSKLVEGKLISPKDEFLEVVENFRSIDFAGPLAGHHKGLATIDGRPVLVTKSPNLIHAVPGRWPHLKMFLDTLLGEEQSQILMAHLKITLEALRSGRPRAGQVVVLSGPVGCGKSLLAALITLILGGGTGSPYQYLTGATQFNKDLFSSVMLLIDDVAPTSDPRARKVFGTALKAATMNTFQRCHGKGEDGVTLNPLWRIFVLVNDDTPSLMVLPALDSGLADKIHIFKAGMATFPLPAEELHDKDRLLRMLADELPAFVAFLESWPIPAHVSGGDTRFGIKAFRHPDIVELMDGVSDDVRMLEMVDGLLFSSGQAGTWEGTASKLEQELREASPSMAGRLFFGNSICGQLLGQLAKHYPAEFANRL